jgi:protein involved in polysaccharide export with SLBB domain
MEQDMGDETNLTTRPSSKVVGPLTARSDFQQYVEDAVGHPVRVYGRQLFDEVPTTFAPMDRIPVPANYAVGPGDELLIRVWGKIDLDARVTLDRNGQISLPKVGTLSVAGLRYDQLEGYLRKAIGNLFKDFELNVTLGQLRSIQVFVLGNARQPGAYTVSSLSTLVDALLASGGPSETGTMRHIELRRSDRLMIDFDLYDLLRNGDKSKDVQLLPGDVIYIPPIGPQAAIIGSVNDPGIYELHSETSIASALKCAGGPTILAREDRILLERIVNHGKRNVEEFALDVPGLDRVLRDGDLLRLFPISPQFENAVTLRGNVQQPGRVLWHEGMRVSDLIPSRDVLVTREHWNQQNHLTGNLNADGTQALRYLPPGSQQRQQIQQSQQDRSNENPNFDGNTPPNYSPSDDHWDLQNQLASAPHSDFMTDIGRTSAEINWEYASIERLDEHDLSPRLIPFNLGRAIDDTTSADNQQLKNGDVITIFSRKDLPLPLEKRATFVRIAGEVNAAGVYRVNPGESLRDLVGRAGGLTPTSYLYASQLTRVSTRLAEEEQVRISLGQMQKELVSRYAAAPSLNSTNAEQEQAQYASQQAAIAQLGEVHPTGRIVLDMKPSANTVADIPDFTLEDGDAFVIPPKLDTIQVSGAVYNATAFRFQNNKRLSAYLNDAGGPTRQADVKRAFLIRADGAVVSRQSHSLLSRGNFSDLALLPGDAIIVPTKMKSPGGFMQQLPYVTQILSQTAMTGALVAAH